MKKLLITAFMGMTMAVCGCVYHPPIFQGNMITPKMVESVHVGMTSAQVVEIMGTPVLRNMYADNTATYVYTSEMNHKPMSIRRLEIDFRNDRVSSIRTSESKKD